MTVQSSDGSMSTADSMVSARYGQLRTRLMFEAFTVFSATSITMRTSSLFS